MHIKLDQDFKSGLKLKLNGYSPYTGLYIDYYNPSLYIIHELNHKNPNNIFTHIRNCTLTHKIRANN